MAVPLGIASMRGAPPASVQYITLLTCIFNDFRGSNIRPVSPSSPFSLGVSGRDKEKNLMLVLLFSGMSNILSNITRQELCS